MTPELLTLNGAVARMNKLEARFWREWLLPRLGKEYEAPGFEELKLRIGDDCFYTPDFTAMKVMVGNECPECSDCYEWVGPPFVAYEVKGFWRDDARVKIKAAAARYAGRIAFYAATWDGKGRQWKIEAIRAA